MSSIWEELNKPQGLTPGLSVLSLMQDFLAFVFPGVETCAFPGEDEYCDSHGRQDQWQLTVDIQN